MNFLKSLWANREIRTALYVFIGVVLDALFKIGEGAAEVIESVPVG